MVLFERSKNFYEQGVYLLEEAWTFRRQVRDGFPLPLVMWWFVCQHHFAGKMNHRFLEMEGVAMKQRVGNLLGKSVFGVCVLNDDTHDIFESRLGGLSERLHHQTRRKTPRAGK